MTGAEKAKIIRDYQAQANGTDQFYRHQLGRISFTDGVKLLGNTAGAYWLVDLIASYQPQLGDREEFQVWELTAPEQPGKPWVAAAWSDTPGKSRLLARQEIPYSDFPTELSPFRLWLENNLLMLPEER